MLSNNVFIGNKHRIKEVIIIVMILNINLIKIHFCLLIYIFKDF